MDGTRFGAPWGRSLWISSTIIGLAFVSAGVAIPVAAVLDATFGPWQQVLVSLFGVGLSALVLGVSARFAVLGYTVKEDEILVHRLGWTTHIPLRGMESAAVMPYAARYGTAGFGNRGLFAITGRFRNGALGYHRAFVTDHARTVALRFADSVDVEKDVLVLSPDDPEAFVALVNRQPRQVERAA